MSVSQQTHNTRRGRPRKGSQSTGQQQYFVQATIEVDPSVIAAETPRAGRFILATNVLDKTQLSDDDLLEEYKAQQSTERGFRFLKDPLFFTSSVCLKSPERVAALAMVMASAVSSAFDRAFD